jgi:hypothetical protein
MTDDASVPERVEGESTGEGAVQAVPVEVGVRDRIRSKRVRVVALILLVIGAPLAYPAWAIERAIRRYRPDFQFAIYNSAVYFSVFVVISVTCVIFIRSFAVQLIAIYLLTLMELISLATCAVIAAVRAGRLQKLMLTVTRRSFRPQVVVAGPATIFAAFASIVHAVIFFAAISFVLWRTDASYFGDLPATSTMLYSFWQFMQNSFMTIINNSGPLVARRFASQVLSDFERIVGIYLLVFVLGILASGWAERAVQRLASDRGLDDSSETGG